MYLFMKNKSFAPENFGFHILSTWPSLSYLFLVCQPYSSAHLFRKR